MQQLMVFDPNTGDWFEQDEHMALCRIPKGKPFVGPLGGVVCISQGDAMEKYTRMTLTPIPAPVWATLGENVMATVPDEAKSLVTGEYRAPYDGETRGFGPKDCFTREVAHGLVNPCIIFSPPPAPPKTDREALIEIQERLRGIKAVVATREFLDEHLAQK